MKDNDKRLTYGGAIGNGFICERVVLVERSLGQAGSHPDGLAELLFIERGVHQLVVDMVHGGDDVGEIRAVVAREI